MNAAVYDQTGGPDVLRYEDAPEPALLPGHVKIKVEVISIPNLEASIKCLAPHGEISMVGQAGREPMRVDVGPLIHLNASINGVYLGAEILTPRVRAMIAERLAMAAQGDLDVPLDCTFPLSEAAAARAFIENRRAIGRVTLIP